jgi:hypothetical protein
MVGGESVSSTSPSRSAGRYGRSAAWDLFGLLGFALFLVGGTDFLLSWFPARFGNPEWEFGTITAALNGTPVPLMGLTLLLVAVLESESVVWARILSVLMVVWAVALVGMAVIYGLTLPLAARGFETPNIGIGLKRAIVKSLVQLVVYPVIMVWMGIRGLRLARTLNS